LSSGGELIPISRGGIVSNGVNTFDRLLFVVQDL
jgi:hypothetical protein